MDKVLSAAIDKADPVALLTIQVAVLTYAVKALLATHPNPALARRAFDQVYGQAQASSAWMPAAPEAALIARHFAEALFPEMQ